MRRILFLLFVLSTHTFAQILQPSILSLQGFGGTLADQFISLPVKTYDGGFILQMSSNSPLGTGNIDNFCNLGTSRVIFLKYNSDATTLEWSWCAPYNNSGDSSIAWVIPTQDGGKIAYGGFNSPGGGLYIAKYDVNDKIAWSKEYSRGTNVGIGGYPLPTADGGYIMLGASLYTDTNVTVHYGSWMNPDMTVFKIDSLGNKQWCKVYGGTGYEYVTNIIEAPDGGCYIVGSTNSNDYDCTGNHSAEYDAYVARLDSNGNKIWHRLLGGSEQDRTGGACSNGKGGVVLAVASASSDGDVHNHIGSRNNFWVIELDSDGSVIWDNCYGSGVTGETPYGICKATDGSIWIAGVSQSSGGHVSNHYGRNDAFFVHTDSIGTFLSAKVLGGSENDRSAIIHPLSNNKIIAGGFYSKNDGEFSSLPFWGVPFTSSEAFLVVFSPWTTSTENIFSKKQKFTVYPNPAKQTVHIKIFENSDCVITIYDNSGKKVYSNKSSNSLTIDISKWSAGMYRVTYEDAKGERSQQSFIIQ